MTEIRPGFSGDLNLIMKVHLEAFGATEGKEISNLVKDLIHDQSANPTLSLVAVQNQKIVGHVLFTPVEICDHPEFKAQILAPLGVDPKYQKQGIARKVIEKGLEKLKQNDTDLIFVLGDPKIYHKFGFKTASGFTAPHPIPDQHQDAWMVQNLTGIQTKKLYQVKCSTALGDPKYWL